MTRQSLEEKHIIESIRSLPPEKRSEVFDFIEFLKSRSTCEQRSGIKGLWRQFSVELSDDNLAELRRDMWGDFPRESSK